MKGVTAYQLGVLQVAHAAPAGAPIDLDQMLEQLPWKPSKESTQFVIRSLIAKGYLAKTGLVARRSRRRVCYLVTESGRKLLDPRPAVAAIPEVESQEIPGLQIEEMDSEIREILES